MKSLLIWFLVILAGVGGNYIVIKIVEFLKVKEKIEIGSTLTTRIIGYLEVVLFFLATIHLGSGELGDRFYNGIFFVFISWTALKFLGYNPNYKSKTKGVSLGAQRRILIIGTLLNAIIGIILGLFFREVI